METKRAGARRFACWSWLFSSSILLFGIGGPAKIEKRSERAPRAPLLATDVVPLSAPKAALDELPLYFIENRGQSDPRVAYYIQLADSGVYFTSEGVTFALTEKERPAPTSPSRENDGR